MSIFSRLSLRGTIAGLLVLIGAAGGPAHALLNLNALSTNALISNALSNNALISNALTPTSLLDVGSLNGVVVEGIALPPNAGR